MPWNIYLCIIFGNNLGRSTIYLNAQIVSVTRNIKIVPRPFQNETSPNEIHSDNKNMHSSHDTQRVQHLQLVQQIYLKVKVPVLWQMTVVCFVFKSDIIKSCTVSISHVAYPFSYMFFILVYKHANMKCCALKSLTLNFLLLKIQDHLREILIHNIDVEIHLTGRRMTMDTLFNGRPAWMYGVSITL